MKLYRRAVVASLFAGVLGLSLGWCSLVGAEPALRRTSPAQEQQQPSIQVYFSPDGGCTEAVVKQIQSAKRSIDIQAYSFTSTPIAKAIADAHQRGVAVRALLDKSQRTAKYTSATFLANAGVPTFIDDKHAIAHNKIILIDGQTVITGSFNFTKAAEESNAENLLILGGQPRLFEAYATNFQHHLAHAQPYTGVSR
jgi:phosphatidylserine/phosphatidylglycerophosphate/cardiolipin synthase-like enzyme